MRVHFKHRLTGVVQLKLALSQAVAEVPDRLTAPRVTVVGGIKHTGCLVVGSEQGVRLSVASRQGVSEVTKDVCLHHHEKVDGSGYPKGLNGDSMSLFAKMGAVCDVYDAVTSNRPYKAGWDPAESIKRMAEWKGHFDPAVFQAFVKSLGIYPIGSLVRLESGKLGVVTEQGEQSLLKPKVKVFFSTKSQAYIKPEIIDLARSPEKIAGREDAAKWGIKDVDRYWAGDKA